ncbi:MAG: VOC family protein [Acidimicrobiales bacterium]
MSPLACQTATATVTSGRDTREEWVGGYGLDMAEFRVVFTARDYEAAVGFFADTMGLYVLRSFDQEGRGTILLAADGQIEVLAHDGEGAPDPVRGARLAWEVDDADAEHERLRDAGVEVVQAPTVQPWGHKSFVVRGPDGWLITLYQQV